MADTRERVSKLVTQVAHGFVRGTPVRFNGSDWVLAVAGDAGIGLVGDVRSNSVFEYVFMGFLDGLSGLTRGELYYVNADGELTTDSSGTLVLRAYDAVSGFIIAAGVETETSTSTPVAGATVASVVAVATSIANHIADNIDAHAASAISYAHGAHPEVAEVAAALDVLLAKPTPPAFVGDADEIEPLFIPGPRGPDGVGTQGIPGLAGDDGDDAPIVPGPRGRDGVGIQGIPGIAGEDGDDALVIPGPRGVPGAPGAPGEAGATGAAGPAILFILDAEEPEALMTPSQPSTTTPGGDSFDPDTIVVDIVNGLVVVDVVNGTVVCSA